jgi:hypothetical protein
LPELTQEEALTLLQQHGGVSSLEAEQIYDYTGGSLSLLNEVLSSLSFWFSSSPSSSSSSVDSVLLALQQRLHRVLIRIQLCVANTEELTKAIGGVHHEWSPQTRCLLDSSLIQFASVSLTSFVAHDRLAEKALKRFLNAPLPEAWSLHALRSSLPPHEVGTSCTFQL